MSIETVVSVVAGVVGLLLLWGGWKEFRARPDPSTFVTVDGEIVDLMKPFAERRDGRRLVVSPVVTYRTPEGEDQRFTSGVARYPSPWVVGQRVTVRLAGSPRRAELASEAGKVDAGWLWSVGLGSVFVAVAVFVGFFFDRLPG